MNEEEWWQQLLLGVAFELEYDLGEQLDRLLLLSILMVYLLYVCEWCRIWLALGGVLDVVGD